MSLIKDNRILRKSVVNKKNLTLPVTAENVIEWKCNAKGGCMGTWKEKVKKRAQFTLCPYCEPDRTRRGKVNRNNAVEKRGSPKASPSKRKASPSKKKGSPSKRKASKRKADEEDEEIVELDDDVDFIINKGKVAYVQPHVAIAREIVPLNEELKRVNGLREQINDMLYGGKVVDVYERPYEGFEKLLTRLEGIYTPEEIMRLRNTVGRNMVFMEDQETKNRDYDNNFIIRSNLVQLLSKNVTPEQWYELAILDRKRMKDANHNLRMRKAIANYLVEQVDELNDKITTKTSNARVRKYVDHFISESERLRGRANQKLRDAARMPPTDYTLLNSSWSWRPAFSVDESE